MLLVEIQRKTVTRVTPGGKVEVVAQLSGGPNGLAMGPNDELFICNNGGFLFQTIAGYNRTKAGVPEGYAGGYIEKLNLKTGKVTVLYDRCGDHLLTGPNDIVFDNHGGFYFTDLGKTYPRYRMNGGLYYAKADGSMIVEVAYPMTTPNGCGLSPDGSVLYGAETETGRLWAFDLKSRASPRSMASCRRMAAGWFAASAAIIASTAWRWMRRAIPASPRCCPAASA